MSQEKRRVVYELERDGRTVYCSSFAVVSVLLAIGWTLSDSGRWTRPGRAPAARRPMPRYAPHERSG